MPGTAARESIAEPGSDSDDLRARLRALRRFVELTGPRVPAARLASARTLIEKSGRRLELSGRHTVVALAGTTGSGKSSLFNAVSGLDLSRVAVRRPTTSELHACVWAPSGAEPLLDWLGVPAARRTARESALDGDDEAPLRGLVLLDLPDFDSIDPAHRIEVDRLIGLVDLVIWVVDPQKYADRTVHERYLQPMASRDTATAVVLNQVDRLSPEDARGCAADLRRLLADDGLAEASLHLTSARTREGVSSLRDVLAGAVADRRAASRRLAADLSTVTDELSDLAGGGRHVAATEDPPEAAPLVGKLSTAAGVPGMLDGAEADYRRRGRRATGWLFVRWALGGRDPRRRLEQERYDLDWLDDRPAEDSGTEPHATEGAAALMPGPVREYVSSAGAALPEPWGESVQAAAREQTGRLADDLSGLPERLSRPRPGWWSVLAALQWLLGGCAMAGLVWLLVAALAGPMGYPAVPLPSLGPVALPLVLLVGGVVLGVLLAVAASPAVSAGAREYRHRLSDELAADVSAAAQSAVLDPVAGRLHEYAQARAALAEAAG